MFDIGTEVTYFETYPFWRMVSAKVVDHKEVLRGKLVYLTHIIKTETGQYWECWENELIPIVEA